jgi:hypothetical protein
LALLSLVPAFWSKLPATMAGFAALLCGFNALGEIKRSGGKKRGMKLAAAGAVCGALGMLIGPLVIAPLAKRHSEHSGRQFTESNLRQIGGGLQTYYNAKGAFPPGGVFRKSADGHAQGLHGWMTLLLPYIGEEPLFHAIDLDRPYDDAVNRTAVANDVPVYFAAGADRAKVHRRFGVAHFSGVGGEVVDDQGGYAQAGIFDRNSEVTRDAITDGLSNTLAAGEIAYAFPAWADPENWRTIGAGLNRDAEGFGNADASGACFLMADGSVRFLSNRTDARVLTALSTRDGGEKTVSKKP